MTITFTASDRLRAAANEWGDDRLMADEEALETKAEQALLEVEHLVGGATDVEFDVAGEEIHHEPSDDLAAFLEQQADATGLDPATVLQLHVDLFARTFLDDDVQKPTHGSDDPRPGR